MGSHRKWAGGQERHYKHRLPPGATGAGQSASVRAQGLAHQGLETLLVVGHQQIAVVRLAGLAVPVDDGGAAAERAVQLHVQRPRFDLQLPFRVQRPGHGDRIGGVPAAALAVFGQATGLARDQLVEAGAIGVGLQPLLGFFQRQAVGDGGLPVRHQQVLERGKHHMRRFRIEGDVEFGRRGDVAVAGDRPAHHHDALDALGQGRVQLQCQRQVGQRAKHHQHQFAGMLVRQAQDGQRSVLGLSLAARRRQVHVAVTITAVHMGSVDGGMQQRIRASGKHRHVGAADDVAELEGVADGVLQADIAGGDGQGDHVMPFIGKGHQQGQGVVHTGVGVDQQGDLVGHRCRKWLF